MRIGIVTSWLEGGGAERQAAIWARLCVDAGHDVTVMTFFRTPREFEVPGARIVDLHKRGATDLPRLAWRIRRAARHLDGLVAFEPYPALCCALSGTRRPWILVTGKLPEHWSDASRLPPRLVRAAFERATLLTAPSQGMIDSHRALGIRPDGPWRLVPNIIDDAAFTPPDADRSGVLFVGRLVTLKHPVLAVESATAAGAPITLLGTGELEPEVRAAIDARPPGSPPARIHPYEPSPWVLYAQHRVLVVTSEYESFGNVVVESLAAGTPVVSVDCDFGPREIIGEASFSHLVRDRSVESIAAALRSVLDRPYGEPEAAECIEIASRYRESAIAPLIDAVLHDGIGAGQRPRGR